MAVFIVSYEISSAKNVFLLRSAIETKIKEYPAQIRICTFSWYVEVSHTNKARDIRDEFAHEFSEAKRRLNDNSADIFMIVHRVKKNWATLKRSDIADWLDHEVLE